VRAEDVARRGVRRIAALRGPALAVRAGLLRRLAPSFDELSAAAALRMAYLVLLRREPDDGVVASTLPRLKNGELSRWDLVDLVRGSDEARTRVPFSVGALGAALHLSRVEFILGLPPARRIIDLGGSNVGSDWGALVLMGYPYDVEEIVIVDLPPEERHELYRSRAYADVMSPRGPVRYRFHSMNDLSFAADATVDLVYSGQTFEHVSPEDGRRVLDEVRRVLRPGGWFALDTPNGAVTRLQQESFIDPDHEVEYTLPELRALLLGAGFEVVEEKGLAWAGPGISEGRFSPEEVAAHAGVYRVPEECYLLALLARKPS